MFPFGVSRPQARSLALLLVLAALGAGCAKSTRPVVVPPLSRVDVIPSADTLQVGQIRVFTAVAYDTNSTVVSVPFTWSSTAPAVASVNILGQVAALGEGTALIIAAAGSLSDTALVAVYPDTGWIAQTSNATEDLHGIHIRPDGRHGYAVGSAGLILSTSDAGATWAWTTPSNFTLNAVWF